MTQDDLGGKKPPPRARSSPESLDEALSTLADMLDRQRAGPPEGAGAERVPSPVEPPTDPPADPQPIPLLSEVVFTRGTGDPAHSARPQADDAHLPPTDEEVYRRIIERLSSEIEVIVQTGVDEAMREAQSRIAAQIKQHVDIMLPEILDELARVRTRGGS